MNGARGREGFLTGFRRAAGPRRESAESQLGQGDREGIILDGVEKYFPVHGPSHGDSRFLQVLDRLSVIVQPGEFVTIVGPSGCGKTTLLRVVAGLESVDGGTVMVGAQRVRGPGPERAMVFQHHSLLPWATVLANVAFGLQLRHGEKSKRIDVAKKLIQMVGLTGFESAYPGQLSGGMQQRVNLARALAVDPEYLLMDEPFGSLDEITRRLLQDELLRVWHATKKTVLFVTHSVEEAIYLADRVVVLGRAPEQRIHEIPVPLARPRTRAIETSEPYVRVRATIWGLLDEMFQGDASTYGLTPEGDRQ